MDSKRRKEKQDKFLHWLLNIIFIFNSFFPGIECPICKVLVTEWLTRVIVQKIWELQDGSSGFFPSLPSPGSKLMWLLFFINSSSYWAKLEWKERDLINWMAKLSQRILLEIRKGRIREEPGQEVWCLVIVSCFVVQIDTTALHCQELGLLQI